MFVSRNEALGFAQRTRKNLELVKWFCDTEDKDPEFHLVTHVMNSLLGLVILPRQRHLQETFWKKDLEELVASGWPKWNISLDEPQEGYSETKTLGRLTTHLRNAAAHGRFRFAGEAESRKLHRVTVIVTDAPGNDSEVNWKAEISGEELYRFCIKLAEYIEESLG